MARKNRRFSDEIRSAVLNCGKTRYRLAKESGVHESVLSRFVRGKCNLSLNALDKLAPHVGLHVAVRTEEGT